MLLIDFKKETDEQNSPGDVMLRSGEGTVSVRSTVLEKDRWRIGRPCKVIRIKKTCVSFMWIYNLIHLISYPAIHIRTEETTISSGDDFR